MAFLLACMFTAQGPGPLDAFKANEAAIQVNTEFLFESGTAARSVVSSGTAGTPGGVPFDANSLRTVVGRWEFDGTTEHLDCAHPPDVDAEIQKSRKPGQIVAYQPAAETIWDGETAAWHTLHEGDNGVQVAPSIEPPFMQYGPFMWFGPSNFPSTLASEFPGVKPIIKPGSRGGRPTEVLIYRSTINDGWQQYEISLDPGIGYLPRFARIIGVSRDEKGKPVTYAKEMYLIEASPCGAGGFAPTEWYVAAFEVDELEKHYPNYDAETVLTPNSSRVGIAHYKTTKFKDRKGPVQLDRLDGVQTISGYGGTVNLTGSSKALTLDEIKTKLGRDRLAKSAKPSLPSIDAEDLHRFDQGRTISPWAYIGGPSVLIALIAAVIYWRRSTRVLSLLLLVFLPGCGAASRPVPRLTAAFKQPRLIYEAGGNATPMTLLVTNEGNRTLEVFEADGGCSCRRVERSTLPSKVRPGQTLELSVSVQNRREFTPQQMIFTFLTDFGKLTAPVELQAIPDHHLSPDSVALALAEGDGEEKETFEIVHRAVFRRDGVRTTPTLAFPAKFSYQSTDSHSGIVEGAPEFGYEDKTYKVTLRDPTLGLHKETVALTGEGKRRLREVPVTWNRRAFLSTAPERAILGVRPTRVFLICPDEDVELAEILSKPAGVNAVVSSARTLTLRPMEDAPDVIDGVIEVRTTARDRPPLRIPVVRYVPKQTQSKAESGSRH